MSICLLFATGCATEETPHFWRFPKAGQETVMYLSGGRAYLIAFGRVYEYEGPSDQDRSDEFAPVTTGTWREVQVADLPAFEPIRYYRRAPDRFPYDPEKPEKTGQE